MNKETERDRVASYYDAHPWGRHRQYASARCNYKKHSCYKYYGGKGIKMLMTNDDFKSVWVRDKAHLMKQPSIHRIDHTKNYTIDNCEFIELSVHLHDRPKRFCEVEGCSRKHYALGFCVNHYYKDKRKKRANMPKCMSQSEVEKVIDRFLQDDYYVQVRVKPKYNPEGAEFLEPQRCLAKDLASQLCVGKE